MQGHSALKTHCTYTQDVRKNTHNAKHRGGGDVAAGQQLINTAVFGQKQAEWPALGFGGGAEVKWDAAAVWRR